MDKENPSLLNINCRLKNYQLSIVNYKIVFNE